MILTEKGKFSNLDKVETGDILIYNSIHNTSFGISFLTKSIYTHVGIAVWADIKLNMKFSDTNEEIESSNEKKLLIFETDLGEEKFDYIKQKYIKNNVRLILLEDNLKNVNKIYVRKINVKRDTEFYKKFNIFINKYKEIPYETDKITILLYMMGLGISSRKKDEILNSAICTELVSKYLNTIFNIKNKYIYPKNFSIEHDYSIKEKYMFNEQIKIYDAEFKQVIIILGILFIILVIGAIILRSYSLFYKK